MRLRKLLRKVHRWVGLLASLWLLQLAVTGLLIQLADPLGLTKRSVQSAMILKWFDFGRLQQAFDVAEDTVVQIDDRVSLHGVVVDVPEPILAVARSGGQWLLATSHSLRWYNNEGSPILQVDEFDGLPTPVDGLFVHADQVYVQHQQKWYAWQADDYQFSETELRFTASQSGRALNDQEQAEHFASLLKGRLTAEKVLHGIHSGLKSSFWLNVLSALALLYLCLSGIYLFFKQPRTRKNK